MEDALEITDAPLEEQLLKWQDIALYMAWLAIMAMPDDAEEFVELMERIDSENRNIAKRSASAKHGDKEGRKKVSQRDFDVTQDARLRLLAPEAQAALDEALMDELGLRVWDFLP
jgi:hypothetical protein